MKCARPNCNKEFTPNTRGQPRKYCSPTCRVHHCMERKIKREQMQHKISIGDWSDIPDELIYDPTLEDSSND